MQYKIIKEFSISLDGRNVQEYAEGKIVGRNQLIQSQTALDALVRDGYVMELKIDAPEEEVEKVELSKPQKKEKQADKATEKLKKTNSLTTKGSSKSI